MFRWFFPFAWIVMLSCGGKSAGPGETIYSTDTAARLTEETNLFPYDLGHPSQKFKMPGKLTEISAISMFAPTRIACVQDEDGVVFIFDINSGTLTHEVDFGKKGDYEGIAVVGDTVFVLSSNGNLHQIIGFGSDRQVTNVLKTSLNEENDTEGLCYDPAGRRLLIACKKDPGKGLKGYRAVYAFHIENNTLSEKPVYLVKMDEIKGALLKKDKQKVLGNELKNVVGDDAEDVSFQPSEIARHPVSGDIYLISTVGKLLVVLRASGKLKSVHNLDPDTLKQPEGLCFAEDGTMFISDEGRTGHGNILEFKYYPE